MRRSARGIWLAAEAIVLVAGVAFFVLRVASCEGRSLAERHGAAAEAESGRGIRVEVLNAAGIPRLARQVTEQLRRAGFDVVYYGNASTSGLAESLVLDRAGSPERARAVADALGITQVRSRPDTSLHLDVTVLLGSDGAARADSATAAAGAPRRPRSVWERIRQRLSRLVFAR